MGVFGLMEVFKQRGEEQSGRGSATTALAAAAQAAQTLPCAEPAEGSANKQCAEEIPVGKRQESSLFSRKCYSSQAME